MPDTRSHRGAAPQDESLFDEHALPALRDAVLELSWLLSRGYSDTSALALVGNRHSLTARQRTAVMRCACTDAQRDHRRARALPLDAIRDRDVDIDGFNALIVGESALSGGLVLVGRDRAHRDLASVHGTWRRVSETSQVIVAIGEALARGAPRTIRWHLDRPVGNSGRLRALLAEIAEEHGWHWAIDLDDAPDRVLAASSSIVATGDGWILDRVEGWIDLPAAVIAAHPGAWLVDLAP
ncbi:DUF434 domain-containing protein [Sandaracinus amylolyticus]|uniref:DUF434 domain-containing protein n=1 Tax=Sandaracinus amylolyticus TaxID=927083 RepID=UPI001F31E33A|nr:DUF434 domain-containing protein [Sandaracinus amylolyticus]UJR82051.1 DUF434 domain-containing protein [Sandaracinus amylolyticus]